MRIEGVHPPLGSPKFTLVGPATLGWKIGACFNQAGDRWIDWGDVAPPMEGLVASPLAPKRELIKKGKVPEELTSWGANNIEGTPGSLAAGYHCAYAGTTNGIWMTTTFGVYHAADGINFSSTPLSSTSPVVDPNAGAPLKSFAQKGAADNNSASVYYIFLWDGLHRTLDGGTTFAKLTWLPDPAGPIPWGLVAINPASSLTSGRRSQIAFSPNGGGVYISNDGGTTGTSIVGSTGVVSVSCMWWVGSTLYVIACDTSGNEFTQNIYKWTGSGNLVRFNTGLNGGTDYAWRFGMADPGHSGGFFLNFGGGGDFARTTDGTTFVHWLTNFSDKWSTMRVEPREAPIISEKFKVSPWAPSMPVCNATADLILFPTGEGVIGTQLSTFPTGGFDGTFATEPVWQDFAGGGQADGMLCGQQPIWSKDQLWIGCQDIHVSRDEDGRRGHRAAFHYYPHNLADCNGIGKNPNVPGYLVSKINRLGAGQNGPHASYTTNADTYGDWREVSNQFPVSDASSIEPGQMVAGPLGVMWSFNCYNSNGARPQVKTSFAGAPQNLRFWIGSTEQIYNWNDDANVANGNQGANFAAVHHQAFYDWTSDRCWYVHQGSGPKAGSAFLTDPNGDAGLYATNPGDYVNFYRVKAGHPSPWLSRGYYDCQLTGDYNGHLVWRQGYFPDNPYYTGNPTMIYNIATNTWTSLTGATNLTAMDFGSPYPGYSTSCFWGIGWKDGATTKADYGLFYNPDIAGGGTTYGPFGSDEVQQWGNAQRLAMMQDENGFTGRWGEGAFTCRNRGGVKFKWTFAAP